MKKIISKTVERIKPSGIREFFDLVIGMKDVISLGVGEPDFVTPWNICESAIFSLEKGRTSYTSNKGLYELRLGISKYIKNKFSLSYNPDQNILVTTGVSEAVDLALRAILNRGDKILVQDPSYVSYEPISELAGGKVILMKTGEDSGFKLTPKLLKKYILKGVKAVIINYPNNPTGVSYSRKELLSLSKIFVETNLIVISDEIYDELTYDFQHTNLATLPGMKQRTIYLNGFSKAFAMTGWRVGYACGPEEIISAMTKIHQYTMLCAPIMSQLGAMEALRSSGSSVLEMKREYKRRREFIVSKLNEIGLNCAMPEGTFYVFPSIKNTGINSAEFAKKLLYKEKVAVVPGIAFGSQGEGHVRIAYASSMDNLKEATQRIEHFLKSRNYPVPFASLRYGARAEARHSFFGGTRNQRGTRMVSSA